MNRSHLLGLLTLALGLLVTSCKSQQESPELAKADLQILQARTFLPVTGGESIIRTDKAPAQAYSSESWLSVTTEGTIVRLQATANSRLESRNALLVLKDSRGDSLAVNIMQEGIIFGLPKEQAMIGGDQALERTLKLASNVPVTYSASADWITLKQSDKQLHASITANATGAPRTGWIIAQSGSLVDSLQVTQASLSDITGTYTQSALELVDKEMVRRSSTFQIERLSDILARLTIDGQYTIEAAFTPGIGLELLNGKVGKTSTGAQSNKVYHVSVLVADDFTFEHKNLIVGTREPVRLAITRDGKLVFDEVQRLASDQRWASYGFVTSSSDRITQGTYTGIDRVFVQPTLTK